MNSQELVSAMKEMLDEIKEIDPQEDVTEILKSSKLGEIYEGCLSNEEIKNIPNKKAAREPTPGVDEIAKMMM
ncbi:hypothetical protein [Clostridium sp.]|uniref:hypothetical protein n=1 Tax=Clostridium sp. TaxID=1506 RepID=UPI002914BA22|nr:hypothetical protein [Clostridium sp.]MDU7363900.1 hypothetical protein [Clostridium sp.]